MQIINMLIYRINKFLKPKITNRGDFLELTKEQLEELKKVEIGKTNSKRLYDVTNLDLNISENIAHRSQRYFKLVGNPYTIRVGEIGVKLSFGDGKSFSDAIMEVVTNSNCH